MGIQTNWCGRLCMPRAPNILTVCDQPYKLDCFEMFSGNRMLEIDFSMHFHICAHQSIRFKTLQ